MAECREFVAQFFEIKNFAVIRDPHIAAGVAHRLVSAGRKVENRKSPVREAHGAVDPCAGVVGPAVGERVARGVEFGADDRCAVKVEPTDYAAHAVNPFSSVDSCGQSRFRRLDIQRFFRTVVEMDEVGRAALAVCAALDIYESRRGEFSGEQFEIVHIFVAREETRTVFDEEIVFEHCALVACFV